MHAHLNHGYFELSRSTHLKPRFAVFCGELADGYGFSKHWVNPQNDLFISPYKEGSVAAQKGECPLKNLGIRTSLRKPFYSQQDIINKEEILKKFGPG